MLCYGRVSRKESVIVPTIGSRAGVRNIVYSRPICCPSEAIELFPVHHESYSASPARGLQLGSWPHWVSRRYYYHVHRFGSLKVLGARQACQSYRLGRLDNSLCASLFFPLTSSAKEALSYTYLLDWHRYWNSLGLC